MSKKIVQINTVCNGSTGRIMTQIHKEAIRNGYESYCFYGRGNPIDDKCIKIDYKIEILWHVFISRFFNLQGHGSTLATYRMIRKIKKINPDIIHLHNLHGYYINYVVLLKYIKKNNINLVWTLHDCWSFTGHCTYYTSNNCEKWKKICDICKNNKDYPKTYFFMKRTKKEFLKKEKLINSINKITLTVPSNWLKNQVKMSYLKNKRVQVIHNGIDNKLFKPTLDNNIKLKYGIPEERKIILGVAADWGENKGIKYFKELSKLVDDNSEVIVMVGLKENQIKNMPDNIICIRRTEDIKELVKIYSIADVLFNPSIQETFSMVTLEALACGTPCVVLNSTATPELVKSKEYGVVESEKSIEKLYKDLKNTIKTDQLKVNLEEYNIHFINKKYLKTYDKIIGEG